MRLLLDSHALLWLLLDDPQLGPAARRALADPDAEAFVSIASVWELAIKAGRNKLPLPGPIRPFLLDQLKTARIGIVRITVHDALSVASLPRHDHGDPFDRMIAVQALRRNLPVVGNDKAFDAYGVTRIW